MGKLPGFHPCPLWILQEAGWVAISVPAIPVWLLADLQPGQVNISDLNSKIAPLWCPPPAFLALDDWLHDFKKAEGIWLPRKGANLRHPIYMEGGGQAICPRRNFAGGMKNFMIKDISKTQNELDFQ